MTAPGLAEGRGTGQSRGRRGGRGHGGVCRRETRSQPPASDPDEGSEDTLQLGLQGPCLGRGIFRTPLGVLSPGSVATVLKRRASPLPGTTAPEPQSCWRAPPGKGWEEHGRRVWGSRCGSPRLRGGGSSWRTGLEEASRMVPTGFKRDTALLYNQRTH